MKKLYTALTICFFIIQTTSAQVTQQWVIEYNGTGNNTDLAKKILVDANGNTFVTGSSYGASGLYNYTTVKYNSSGVQQWFVEYNGTGNNDDRAAAMALDASGNVYVTGHSIGALGGYNFVTIKYNSSGIQQWLASYNGTGNGNDQARAIALDTSGNVYVTGYVQGAVGGQNFGTVKYNNNGVQQWVVEYNGTGNSVDVPQGVAVQKNGSVYVTGYSVGATGGYNYAALKYNNSGVQQWATTYNGTGNSDDFVMAFALDTNGNSFITGYSIGLVGANNITTLMLNTSGVQQWVTEYNGAGNSNDYPLALALDMQGNSFVTGYSYGATGLNNYATLKINNVGSQQWVSLYNGVGNNDDYAYAIALDTSGNSYVTGTAVGASGLNNYATVKYNNGGVQQWVAEYNGTGSDLDYGQSITIDVTGNVYVTGYVAGATGQQNYATLKYCNNPANAGVITGTNAVCEGQLGVSYSVPAILNATGYNWVLPVGATIAAGANTNSITVDFPVGSVSGNITVQGTNSCTNGTVADFAVVVNPLPTVSNNVIGANTVCQGATWVSYNIPSISNATGYLWALPVGASIISGANTNSINVNFANNAVNGNITVMGTNSCGNGVVSSSFSVVVNPLPLLAGIIVGTDTVCEGQIGVVYSIPAIANASSYNWTVPAGASYVTNAGGDSITVDFMNGVTSGNITVEGINSCGVSTITMLAVVVNYLPGVAGAISGPGFVCENYINATYTVSAIANAVGYNWSVPNGANIIGGNNTNSITVDFPIGAISGNVTVTGTNTCGNSNTASLAVTVIITPPAMLTIGAAMDTLCSNAPGFALNATPAGGIYVGLGVVGGNFYPALAGFGTHQIIYYYNPINCLNCGCEKSDTAYVVVMDCTGINEQSTNTSVKVFPNPASGICTIETMLSKNETVKIEVLNVMGQTLFSSEENAAKGKFTKQISLEGLSKGIYFINLKANDSNSIQKISKN